VTRFIADVPVQIPAVRPKLPNDVEFASTTVSTETLFCVEPK
jgi:hypothetical protein